MKKNYALLLFTLCFAWIAQSQITLSQNSGTSIVAGTIACGAGGVTSDNIYYRNFDLAALGYTQFEVSQVTFGVESATAVDPAFAVDVIIFSNSGAAFPGGTLTEISRVSVPILAADAGTLKNIPIVATVTAPATLVFAISVPNETAAGHTTGFYIASNNLGETAPTYISSVACGLTSPVTLASINFPDVHAIMTVTGISLSVDEFSASSASIRPNPSSDFVNIELHPSNTINTIEIYSITGQLVKKLEGNTRINISDLQTGIYLMQLETTNGTITKKLVKS
ncbi:MAG: T9SS type A sorting domain-containing protein [Aquaticitalea sp.]